MSDSSLSLSVEIKWSKVLCAYAEVGPLEFEIEDKKPDEPDDPKAIHPFGETFLEFLAEADEEEIRSLDAEFEDLWTERYEVRIHVHEDN